MKYLTYSCSFLLVFLLMSCDLQDQNQPLDTSHERDINELSSVILEDLNNIGSELRQKSSTFSDKKSVSNIANTYLVNKYSEESYKDFQTGYNKLNASQTESLTEYQKSLVSEISTIRTKSQSAAEYAKNLKQKFQEIQQLNLAEKRKKFASLYIASNFAGIKFLQNNRDLVKGIGSKHSKDHSWWDEWGKCAAGTIGGAGLGGLSGAGIGGAGCTVVLPVVGTVACGTVGAVVGSISGGLAGAAASC